MSSLAAVEAFYKAFAALDGPAMGRAYHPDAHFHDPVFDLNGAPAIAAMWAMLCENAARGSADVWRIEARDIRQEGVMVRAHWEAHYRFSGSGRLVHNIIEAELMMRDGLIVTHRDSFDFWRWSRQALGLPGLLLGWTPALQNKVKRQAAANLAAWQQARRSG